MTFEQIEAEYLIAVKSDRSRCRVESSGIMARWVICTIAHPNWKIKMQIVKYVGCHHSANVSHHGQIEKIMGKLMKTNAVPAICQVRFVPYLSASNPIIGVTIASPT